MDEQSVSNINWTTDLIGLVHHKLSCPLLLADITTTKISWRRCTESGTHTNSISRDWLLQPNRPVSTRTNTRATCSWRPIITEASSAPSWVPTTEWHPHQVIIIVRTHSTCHNPFDAFFAWLRVWIWYEDEPAKTETVLTPRRMDLFHCHFKTSAPTSSRRWYISGMRINRLRSRDLARRLLPRRKFSDIPHFCTFPTFPLRFPCCFLDESVLSLSSHKSQ